MKIETQTETSQCRIDLIVGYLEGDLSAQAELSFEQHLNECQTCRTDLNREKQIILALETSLHPAGVPELPPDFARTVSVTAVNHVGDLRNLRELRVATIIVVVLSAFALAAVGGATDRIDSSLQPALLLISSATTIAFQLSHSAYVVLKTLVSGIGADVISLFVTLAVAVIALIFGLRRLRG